jgi:hypothetical protein
VSDRRYRRDAEPLLLLGNFAEIAIGHGGRSGALFAHVAVGMAASSRPLIVCLSSTDWGFLRYRKQQLMERLSRHIAEALADIGISLAPADVSAVRTPSAGRETAA